MGATEFYAAADVITINEGRGDFCFGALLNHMPNQAGNWLVRQMTDKVKAKIMDEKDGNIFVVTGDERRMALNSENSRAAQSKGWVYTIKKIGNEDFCKAVLQGQQAVPHDIEQMSEEQVHQELGRTLWAHFLGEDDEAQFQKNTIPNDIVDWRSRKVNLDVLKAVVFKLRAIDELCHYRKVVEVFPVNDSRPGITTTMKSHLSDHSKNPWRSLSRTNIVIESSSADGTKQKFDLALTTVIDATEIRKHQHWLYTRFWEMMSEKYSAAVFHDTAVLNKVLKEYFCISTNPCEVYSRINPDGVYMFVNHLIRQS